MKKFIIVIMVMLVMCGMVFAEGTPEQNAEVEQRRATAQAMNEMQAQVGMPAINNYQERKLAKMIFEMRDKEDLLTYAYIVAQQTGKLVFLGECVGYGLPYSVQFTNPLKRDWSSSQGGVGYLPQADPNGLYMPSGLSATWLMLRDKETGKPRPVYVEPEIIVSPFPLH